MAWALALVLMLQPFGALAAVLEVGSSGADVTKVQQKLIGWGYLTGTADGKYGEKTRAAVAAFQRKNGLTADGRVGAKTAAAMGIALSGASGGSVAASATIISADHRLLSRLVYARPGARATRGRWPWRRWC